MKKTFRRILASIVLASLTVALFACTGDKKGQTTSSITVGIPQDLDGLDPHTAVSAGTKEILFNVYEGLVKPDSDGNLVPAVASAVDASDDGKVYTFTLRDGVKFHDGTAVTVEDVKYSIERCAGTDGSEPLVSAFSNIESVETSDDSTITITLKEADTEFLAYMDAAIIPAANDANTNTKAIGTGPYKLTSWSAQEEVVLEKFDDYWGTPANISTVNIKIIADTDAIVTSLNGGGVDFFARVSADQVAQLSSDYEIYEGPMNLVQALFLNNGVEPFDNVLVRQALCYAADQQNIMDLTSDGKGFEIGSSMFPSFGKYYIEELNDVYNKDVDKAKALLKEAGYEDGFTFTITVPSNYTQHVDTAQVLKEQFKEIGVTAEIKLVEWETWLSEVYADRNYQATVIGLTASQLTASSLLSRFVSDASNNFINFNSEAYDTAYKAAALTTDDDEKTAGYKECETILTNEASSVYIQDMVAFVALNKKYAGYVFYPAYIQDFAKLYVVE